MKNRRQEKKGRPLLVVLSAPSGGGKTTVCAALLKKEKWLKRGITATTRRPRKGERHGRDYYFLTEAEFRRRMKKGGFYEQALVHGHWYGTPCREVEQSLKNGQSLVLVIDVQGGAAVKRRREDALLIFLLPPSMAELQRRLINRATDSPEVIKVRLAAARREIQASKRYDQVIVNADLRDTIEEVAKVVRTELERINGDDDI